MPSVAVMTRSLVALQAGARLVSQPPAPGSEPRPVTLELYSKEKPCRSGSLRLRDGGGIWFRPALIMNSFGGTASGSRVTRPCAGHHSPVPQSIPHPEPSFGVHKPAGSARYIDGALRIGCFLHHAVIATASIFSPFGPSTKCTTQVCRIRKQA